MSIFKIFFCVMCALIGFCFTFFTMEYYCFFPVLLFSTALSFISLKDILFSELSGVKIVLKSYLLKPYSLFFVFFALFGNFITDKPFTILYPFIFLSFSTGIAVVFGDFVYEKTKNIDFSL